MQYLILLVEDDPVLRYLGAKQCELLGFRCKLARSGTEAVQLAFADADLILMDLAMPDMSGLEATSIIREKELEQGRERKPIVAMTAFTQQENRLPPGMDDYIQKPVLLETLRHTLTKWLS